MTSKSARHTTRAFVWTWLPGATSPVVCGAIDRTTRVLDREPVVTFTYASSYLARPDAVSLFPAELPLRRVVHDPTAPERNPDWSGFTPEPGWAPLPLAGHVFTSDQFVYDDTVPQLDNALHIRFVGGYGEFIDGLDVAVGRQQRDTFVLCHQCAHQLCEWFNIDPTGWHGHCSWTHDTSSTRDESEPEPV